MLIIFIMLYYLYKILDKNIESSDKKKIYKIFAFGLIFQLIMFILYRVGLLLVGRDVYYSDAEYYWEATKAVLKGEKSLAYNRLYYMLCAIVQLTSPFKWVGWNNLFNILCVDLSICLMLVIIYKYKRNYNAQYFLYFSLFNPLIYYSLMRNLKDALFLLLVIVLGYALQKSFHWLNKKWLFLFIDFISIPFFYSIRPWAFIIPLLSLIVFIFENRETFKRKKKQICILLILMIVTVFILFGNVIYVNLKIWVPIVSNSFVSRGILKSIVGLGRLFVGPGFIRALFGQEFFEHYLIIGNYMTAIGSFMWIFDLSLLIVMIKKPLKNILNAPAFSKYLFLFFLSYSILYAVQYGGSVELRLRGVLFLTTFGLFFSVFNFQFTKRNVLLGLILFSIISSISILVG